MKLSLLFRGKDIMRNGESVAVKLVDMFQTLRELGGVDTIHVHGFSEDYEARIAVVAMEAESVDFVCGVIGAMRNPLPRITYVEDCDVLELDRDDAQTCEQIIDRLEQEGKVKQWELVI